MLTIPKDHLSLEKTNSGLLLWSVYHTLLVEKWKGISNKRMEGEIFALSQSRISERYSLVGERDGMGSAPSNGIFPCRKTSLISGAFAKCLPCQDYSWGFDGVGAHHRAGRASWGGGPFSSPWYSLSLCHWGAVSPSSKCIPWLRAGNPGISICSLLSNCWKVPI